MLNVQNSTFAQSESIKRVVQVRQYDILPRQRLWTRRKKWSTQWQRLWQSRSNNNNKRSESKKKILKFNPGNSREHETFSKTHEAVKDHIRQKMKDGHALAEAIEDGKSKEWDSLEPAAPVVAGSGKDGALTAADIMTKEGLQIKYMRYE